MRKLLLVSIVLLISLNRCFSNLSNAYTYSEHYDNMDDFHQALNKDEHIIKLFFTLNPGEEMYSEPSIYFHKDTHDIYDYTFNMTHKGLSYYNYVYVSREESRSSGGRLFQGEFIDEEIIYEELTIRTHLIPPTKFGGPLQFIVDFYFKVEGIGFYGEIVHVNEILENFDKTVFIDYIIELYEYNVNGQ